VRGRATGVRLRRLGSTTRERRIPEGCGQPHLAQGEGILGCLERALPEGRADHPSNSRRHGRARTLDKKAPSVSLLVALGVREDGQKVLLAVKNMGGESEAGPYAARAIAGRAL
jgi:hypothetical protein